MITTLQNNPKAASLLAEVLASRPDIVPVFDLDGVLLDASHRIKLHADGSLDLDHYRANTTAEQVAQDKLLPLIECVKMLNDSGRRYHIATARVLCNHTVDKLTASGIMPTVAIGRNGENDRRKDCDLKAQSLAARFSPQELRQMMLIDDHAPNCQAAMRLGMLAVQIERCTLA